MNIREAAQAAINELADALVSSEWISVEDGLPEDGLHVDVKMDEWRAVGYQIDGIWNVVPCDCELLGVTHWRPLEENE